MSPRDYEKEWLQAHLDTLQDTANWSDVEDVCDDIGGTNVELAEPEKSILNRLVEKLETTESWNEVDEIRRKIQQSILDRWEHNRPPVEVSDSSTDEEEKEEEEEESSGGFSNEDKRDAYSSIEEERGQSGSPDGEGQGQGGVDANKRSIKVVQAGRLSSSSSSSSDEEHEFIIRTSYVHPEDRRKMDDAVEQERRRRADTRCAVTHRRECFLYSQKIRKRQKEKERLKEPTVLVKKLQKIKMGKPPSSSAFQVPSLLQPPPSVQQGGRSGSIIASVNTCNSNRSSSIAILCNENDSGPEQMTANLIDFN